jgi:hypothetical protein
MQRPRLHVKTESTNSHEKVERRMVIINLVMVMLARGEGANVVRGKHIGQTAVVCDQSRNDAKVTSDLDDVGLLVKEACIVIVERITPAKKHQRHLPTAKIKNVDVRKKNKADKPIDLRSEPMLWKTRTSCHQRLIL